MSEHMEGGGHDSLGSGCGSARQAGAATGNDASQAPMGSPAGEMGGAGAMNAYDIPRYDSQGYVLGRPGTPNDPTSAGGIQGAPAGGSPQPAANGYGGPAQDPQAHPAPGTMGHGSMNMANGSAMGGSQMEQPGGQPSSPGMGYMGVDPATGRPVYVSSPMGQPGVQPPPPGMGYMGVDPATGRPVYVSGPMDQPGVQPPPGQAVTGGAVDHYGRIADVVKDLANGEQPDVNKLAALYSGFDTQFWKGALIGAVLTVLLTSKTVRSAVAGTMGGIMGAFKQSEPQAADVGADADAT